MILTDDECRKVYNDAMTLPVRNAVAVMRHIESALLEKLRGGVELPEAFAHAAYEEHPSYEGVGDIVYYHPNAKPANCIDLFTRRQLLAYGAAQRLAGRERAIEECAAECLALHANGNYKHDTREDCHDAIRALAASPQEQQP